MHAHSKMRKLASAWEMFVEQPTAEHDANVGQDVVTSIGVDEAVFFSGDQVLLWSMSQCKVCVYNMYVLL